MDFVTIWKAVSIVLTGAFGILGLTKDFKNKETGQITKWGYVSLCGIVLSTVLGVAAQLKETSDSQKAQAKASADTLALVRKTDQSVTQMSRLLSPLDRPTVRISFDLQCSDKKFVGFCEGAKRQLTKFASDYGVNREGLPDGGLVQLVFSAVSGRPGVSVDHARIYPTSSLWKQWPNGGNAFLAFQMYFFRQPQDADRFLAEYRGFSTGATTSDLDFQLDANSALKNSGLVLKYDYKASTFELVFEAVPEVRRNGAIVSVLDLPGTTMFLTSSGESLTGLALKHVVLTTEKGQQVSADRFEDTRVNVWRAYRTVF